MNTITTIKNMIEDIVEMTLMKVTKVTVDANVQMNCDLHELRELQEVNCEWVRNLELDWSSYTSWSSRKSHSSSELQTPAQKKWPNPKRGLL